MNRARAARRSFLTACVGAAGALEGIVSMLALSRGFIPPTIHCDKPDPECDLDYVTNQARQADVRVAISNTFGFGGTNATLLFRKV